ncbi:hypothetical protein F3J45_27160 [Pantoea sp. Ap-967]|uniref:hypothetical protein n=1 Tax=Pantoea sp. Ap-967 TaxID=2608362 RepID=UPI001421CFD0|nr:hypothetical protein [Pantoea sp. Ap-967]NIE78111.1 hypothetical protein [Pantoea sp. Ap-967]
MTTSGTLTFAIMMLLGAISFLMPPDGAVLAVGLACLFSFAYFVYYIIYRDLHHDIIGGVLLALLVMALVAIPVIGWLILLAFVFYNIAKALEGLKALTPDIITSFGIYGLLCAHSFLNVKDAAAVIAFAAVYTVAALAYCRQLNRLPLREALFKLSVMWLAIPFAVLMVISIFSSLANLFKAVSSTITRTVITPQTVSAHVRSGVEVAAYTRNVTSTVTSTVTNYVPGSGAVTSAVAKEVARAAKAGE